MVHMMLRVSSSPGTLAIIVLSSHTVGWYQCVAWMPAGAVASQRASPCDTSKGLSLGECVCENIYLEFSESSHTFLRPSTANVSSQHCV